MGLRPANFFGGAVFSSFYGRSTSTSFDVARVILSQSYGNRISNGRLENISQKNSAAAMAAAAVAAAAVARTAVGSTDDS